jgi:hypothetical protein
MAQGSQKGQLRGGPCDPVDLGCGTVRDHRRALRKLPDKDLPAKFRRPDTRCLPNPAAQTPGMRPFYERLGFNDRQIEIIAQARPKRDYYCVSPQGRRLFDMALGPLTRAFTGVSDRRQIATILDLNRTHGSDWARQWLTLKGDEDALSLLDTQFA